MFENLLQGGSDSPFVGGDDLASLLAGRGVSVDDLRKALAAGTPYPGSSPGNLAPIVPEDISAMLISATYDAQHLALLREFPSEDATQMIHQYARITAWGSPISPWVNDGDLPTVESDPETDRPFIALKPAVELGAVNVVSNMVKLIPGAPANALALSKMAKAKALASKLIPAILFGDPTIDPKIISGLVPQIIAGAPTDNVIDMRGEILTDPIIDRGANVILNAFGEADVCYMSAGVQRGLAQTGASPRLRINRGENGKGQPTAVGSVAESMLTVLGNVPFTASPFLQPGGGTQSGGSRLVGGKPFAAGYGANKPAAPVIASITPAASATSQFTAADAGNYYYKIVACGPAGWSTPATSGAIAIAKGDGATIVINDAAVTGVTYYQVFRSRTKGLAAADCQWFKDVPKTAGTTFVDNNADIPGTSTAILIKRSPEVFSQVFLGKQLVEMDLGILTDLRYRHVMLTVRGVAVKIPNRVVVFKNCQEPTT